MVENEDESALILEDDVDVEWDLERTWARIRRRLPGERERELNGGKGEMDWDVSFLGHCWGRELLSESQGGDVGVDFDHRADPALPS